MSLFEFLIPLCSYVSIYLSSTYLSLPKMFQYTFYFHLRDKYMAQLSHFPVFFAVYFSKYLLISLLDKFTKQKKQFDWNMTNYLYSYQQHDLQIFLPPLIFHHCTLVFLLYMDSMSLYKRDGLLSHSLLTVNSCF